MSGPDEEAEETGEGVRFSAAQETQDLVAESEAGVRPESIQALKDTLQGVEAKGAPPYDKRHDFEHTDPDTGVKVWGRYIEEGTEIDGYYGPPLWVTLEVPVDGLGGFQPELSPEYRERQMAKIDALMGVLRGIYGDTEEAEQEVERIRRDAIHSLESGSLGSESQMRGYGWVFRQYKGQEPQVGSGSRSQSYSPSGDPKNRLTDGMTQGLNAYLGRSIESAQSQ